MAVEQLWLDIMLHHELLVDREPVSQNGWSTSDLNQFIWFSSCRVGAEYYRTKWIAGIPRNR